MAEFVNDHIINVYANRYRTEWSDYDLRIRFGEMLYVGSTSKSNKKLIIEERVGVTMTWKTAKELRDHLDMLVKTYEEANGEIKEAIVIDTSKKSALSKNL